MKEWLNENGYPDTPDTAAMMDIACAGAKQMGMNPYYLYRQKNMAGNLENTGYATEGKYGIYNILINEEVQDILALGAGAISKRVDSEGNTERSANFKEVHDYIANLDEMIERKRRLWVYND
jgi:oxygen-independent coproporphyrinogen-3 oxidase